MAKRSVFGDYAANSAKGKAGRASAVYDKSWFLAGLLEECKKPGRSGLYRRECY